MRFPTFVAVLGLASWVSAATSSVSGPTSTLATVASTTTSGSLAPSVTSCVSSCKSDICCKATCFNLSCPNDLTSNQTSQCSGACAPSNNTAFGVQQEINCQVACLSSVSGKNSTSPYTVNGTASATGSSGNYTASGLSPSTITSTQYATAMGSATVVATGTGSASSSTSTSNPNSGVKIMASWGTGVVGLLGYLAVIL